MAEQHGTVQMGKGSAVIVQHTERRMKFYLVYKDELVNLSGGHRREVAFSTMAGSLISFAVGLFIQQFFVATLTPTAKILCWIASPVVATIGFLFVYLAIGEVKNRRARTSTIESESRVRDLELP